MYRLKEFPRALVTLALAASLLACDSENVKPPEPAELEKVAAPAFKPREVWSTDTGAGGGPEPRGFRIAHAGDVLYTADHEGRVSAISAKDGKKLWRQSLKLNVGGGPGVAGGRLGVGTLDGELIALERQDGKLAWRAPVAGELLSPPTGTGEVLVAHSLSGRIYGFGTGSGQRLWSFDRNVPTLTLRGNAGPLIAGDRVLTGLDSGKLIAADIQNGQVLWETAVSLPAGRTELERLVDIDTEPALTSDTAYVASYGSNLGAVDLVSGDLRWRQPIASSAGLTTDGQRVYVSDVDGRVLALAAATGSTLWKQAGLMHRAPSRPVVHGGYVAVGDLEGYVHWLSASDGKIVARARPVGAAIITPPVVIGTRLFVLDADGQLSALDIGK
ncbi:MAG: outer membrane protein assembly factor BamB [Gammaproteobacteria bacterium]